VGNRSRLYAAIDLGSNTFHILIAEGSKDSKILHTVFKQRDYVFLSQNGVEHIDQDRYDLGIQTLQKYRKFIDLHEVSNYKVIGTETLRLASNGSDFVREVKEKTDFDIEIIDGLKEANYIYYGVNAYLSELQSEIKSEDQSSVKSEIESYTSNDLASSVARGVDETNIIMDIGGGSVEFIIFNRHTKKWAHSFPIGISILFNNFQSQDPIGKDDLARLDSFLIEKTELLSKEVSKYNIQCMIGSAGSFDILKEMMQHRIRTNENRIAVQDFIELYNGIIPLDFEQRKNIPGLPIERVKLMPMALSLLLYVIKTLNIKKIICCPYSLKEGVIYEMIDQIEGKV